MVRRAFSTSSWLTVVSSHVSGRFFATWCTFDPPKDLERRIERSGSLARLAAPHADPASPPCRFFNDARARACNALHFDDGISTQGHCTIAALLVANDPITEAGAARARSCRGDRQDSRWRLSH